MPSRQVTRRNLPYIIIVIILNAVFKLMIYYLISARFYLVFAIRLFLLRPCAVSIIGLVVVVPAY